MFAPFEMLSADDQRTAAKYIGSLDREPDLTIAPDGNPYLYRWFIVRSTGDQLGGNVYFHMQVADDPERPLHDHPWDNMSVILSGSYRERLQEYPPYGHVAMHRRLKGDVIFRRAGAAHRLFLPAGVPYTLTQFTTGIKVHDWGFWYGDKHVPFDQVTELLPDGRSVHRPGFDARRFT